jgi:hypothetical protein
LQETALPTAPLPMLAKLLEGHGEALALAACRALYDPRGPGWFEDDGARLPLKRWLMSLAGACRTGEYLGVADSSRRFYRHAVVAGGSALECHLFAERFAAVVARGLGQHGGQDELAPAQRLLTVTRHAVLSDG